MKKERIANCLLNYARSGAVRVHMPGHKGEGEGLLQSVYAYDITELSFSDNLSSPTGVILKAEEDISLICSSNRSRILTGGSTLGVLAMIYAVKNRGKKMLVQRTSHKSVFNALELLGIEPVILNEKTKNGLILPEFENEELFESSDSELIGALLTSPDYFGRALNLKSIKQKLEKNNKLLLVDGAHGGHFVYENKELYAGNYAHIWVDGAHKTYQTLTQGAILNINDLSLLSVVEEGLNIFSTSSPSYLIMASVESGIKNFPLHKRKNARSFNKAKQILQNGIKDCGFDLLPCDDNLKVTLDLCGLANGLRVGRQLEKAGVFAELVSENYILFMLSYSFNEESALKIIQVLKCVKLAKNSKKKTEYLLPTRKLSYKNAKAQESEWVNLKDACGRICALNAGVFPPCYPIITAGEVFDNSVIDALLVKNTFGKENNKVKVIKEK